MARINLSFLVLGFSFFILGFVHGYIILWLNGYVARKRLKIPNLWCWHSAWGIFWVVMALRIAGFLSNQDTIALATVFIVSFPGICMASHIQWARQNKKKLSRIPGTLLLDTIKKNGRS